MALLRRTRSLLGKSPRLSAFFLAFLWIIGRIYLGRGRMDYSGHLLTAFIIGSAVGLTRVEHWTGVFKNLPAAFGCLVLVAWIYGAIASSVSFERYHDDLGGQVVMFATMPFMALAASPGLVAGELFGWLFSTWAGAELRSDRPAAGNTPD